MSLLKIATTGLMLIALLSCCVITIDVNRLSPYYTGVDTKAAPYVNEWLSLAKERGFKFNHEVTVGFKEIDKGNTIGLTHYGIGWREIDLSTEYWSHATETAKTSLLWHELCHAYCFRRHDYGADKKYNDGEGMQTVVHKGLGFFDDGCPVSIMFPVMTADICFVRHYGNYTAEMFDRCNPY